MMSRDESVEESGELKLRSLKSVDLQMVREILRGNGDEFVQILPVIALRIGRWCRG